MASPCYYLTLCGYGGVWNPLAIYLGEQLIGFMMWVEDSIDGSCWLGGILIEWSVQRQGYGRLAIEMVVAMLALEHGYRQFAFSYALDNPAKYLYQTLGFTETGEWEDNEVVARLSFVQENTN